MGFSLVSSHLNRFLKDLSERLRVALNFYFKLETFIIKLDRQNPIDNLSLFPLSISLELLSPPKQSSLISIKLKTSYNELTSFSIRSYSQEPVALASTLKIKIMI